MSRIAALTFLHMVTRSLLAFLFLCSLSFASGQKELRILYLNDFHGFARPHQTGDSKTPRGGASWLASRAKQLGKEKPSLFVAAGDMIQGDIWANLFRGESVIKLLNSMGLDVMVVGNHEFDFGQQILIQRIREAKFPMLGANVIGLEGLGKHTMKEIGGVKVALIGVVTVDTPFATHPRNVAGLRFEEPEEVLKALVKRLCPEAELLVVLSHCGYAKDREIAQRVPGIDLIIGGHSHTRLERPVKIGSTLIVQAWEHGKALGVLDLGLEGKEIRKWEGWLEDIWPDRWEPDPIVEEVINHYSRRISDLMGEVVGEAIVDLDGNSVRHEETNLGNLVADVVREFSGAQVAIINGGSIRRGIPSGPVTMEQIYGALPFENYVVAIKLKGAELWRTLEHGLSGRGSGRFPQVSGLKVVYSPQAPSEKRLRGVWVGGEPIEMDKEYVVAVNDFIAAGGDGYKVFTDLIGQRGFKEGGDMTLPTVVKFSAPGLRISDLVVEYLRTKGKVGPQKEGRITEEAGP